jgi:5-methyltetrahydrofolate--homocysteine methyltransferase
MKRISIDAFNELLAEKILIYDGAMGTNLQSQNLDSSNYGGHDGCSEALVLHAPQAVEKVHFDFVKSGCNIIETNTFGATSISLKEYGLENKVEEINQKAVDIARQAIDKARPQEEVLIAGSIGPTSMLPSLGNISFDDMTAAYLEQMEALWQAEVDIFQIETCQDLLQIKAALLAAQQIFTREEKRCVVVVSVTLEPSGTMLVGSDVSAIIATLEPFLFVDVLSINCATGPLEMIRHVDHICRHWPRAVAVMPNAGLPENVDGKPVYKMTAAEFADFHYKFVNEFGVNIVGGCCGTRPEHLQAVVERLSGLQPKKRAVKLTAQAASLFSAAALRQKPAPAMVGERTNANGAKQFRQLLERENWPAMVAMGREQARGGAHLLDLSVAFVGRDEVKDIQTLVPMFATQVNLPLLIDSTNPLAIEAALKRHGGRCVINSVNLEDGKKRLLNIGGLARKYGAALICLTIDEAGMAKTASAKVEIAKRIYSILTEELGFRASDLIFDPLTFTVGSGDKELRTSAAETLEAIRRLSKELPDANSILGVSNVSFGLEAESREILNSVFLQEAVSAGLTCAIVNPARLIPVHSIPDDIKKLALKLIYNNGEDEQALTDYMQAFAGKSRRPAKIESANLLPPEQLKQKVLDGDGSDLELLTKKLLDNNSPQQIINTVLLPAMKEVGELFGCGQLQLPFVLQSAEVVKKTVSILEPLMEKKEAHSDKKMILATVAGDVHDIGKNLVNIMLENNGYCVYDLGIKIDIDEMIRAAQEQNSGVIGMSGLLVRSTQVMKENLQELNRRNFLPAVILGGAALTPEYVANELAPIYKGKVFYARDAIDALKIMEQLGKDSVKIKQQVAQKSAAPTKKNGVKPPDDLIASTNRHQFVDQKNIISPPFFASHLLEISGNDLFSLLSHKVLFQGRWGFKQINLSDDAYENILEKEARPALHRLINLGQEKDLFEAQATYGYYRCRGRKNQIRIFDDARITIGEFDFPRQSKTPNLCLADFVAAETDDVIALWAVTLGQKVVNEIKQLYENNKYSEYHFLHGLAAELADCAAVHVHRHVHHELFPDQPLTENSLKGCRYSFGYPACPDLSLQQELFRILKPERIGMTLSETWQMVPEFSVSGFILLNPHARYFIP